MPGKTLLALVNDLLDLARIESGKLESRMRAATLAEVLDHALGMVRPDALCKGLDLSADIGSDVPPVIVTDPLRLGQVLVNLLGNAVKFTPGRGTDQCRMCACIRHSAFDIRHSTCVGRLGKAPLHSSRYGNRHSA